MGIFGGGSRQAGLRPAGFFSFELVPLVGREKVCQLFPALVDGLDLHSLAPHADRSSGRAHDNLGELPDWDGKVEALRSAVILARSPQLQSDEPVAAACLSPRLEGGVRLRPHVSQVDGLALQVADEMPHFGLDQTVPFELKRRDAG